MVQPTQLTNGNACSEARMCNIATHPTSDVRCAGAAKGQCTKCAGRALTRVTQPLITYAVRHLIQEIRTLSPDSLHTVVNLVVAWPQMRGYRVASTLDTVAP